MELFISELELVTRLVLATVLGGLVGLERETHGRPAGFRTHTLVSVGAALVMLISMYAFAAPRAGLGAVAYDPGRLAAQVVSGIGFLGAGTIIRDGASVRGLTTAASLWAVAGIGLAAGSGFYLGAVVTTGLVVATLFFLSKVERHWLRMDQDVVTFTIADRPGMLAGISSVLGRYNVNIKGVEIENAPQERTTIEMAVEVPPRLDRTALLQELLQLEGVLRASYHR